MSHLRNRLRAVRPADLPPRLIMFMSFAGMSIVNYGFGLVAAWLLAPGDFGLLAFSQTVLTIAGLVLNSGFTWSLTAALVGADPAHRGRLVRGAALANLLLGVVIGAAIALLFALGLLRAGLESWAMTGVVIATLPVLSLLSIARAVAQGSERFGALAFLMVAEVVVKAGAGLGLAAAGFGALGATSGFLVGALCACILGVFYLVRWLHIMPWGHIQKPDFGAAGAMFAALLGTALLLNQDTLGMKLFLPGDRAAVGRYQAGIVLANTPYYLLTAMIPVLFTQIARVKEIRKTGPVVGETLRLALILLLPIEALLAAFPKVFLSILFPPAYLAGADTLRLLALANAAIILVAIFSTAFQATGHAGYPGRILLFVTACEAVALGFIVPAWKGVGAASTFLTATLVALFLLGGAYFAGLEKRPFRQSLAWLARYTLALGIGAIVCAVALRAGAGAILAMAVAGTGYLAAIFALRLLSLPGLLGTRSVRQPVIAAEE